MERTRTFVWEDPLSGIPRAQQLTGIDCLQAILDGELPASPLTLALDFKPVSFEKGVAVFSFVPQEFHYNPIGCVHGGVISAILDSAMGCTVHTLLNVRKVYTTLELKTNFLKQVSIKTGELRAIGKIINKGNRTALVEAQLVDSKGTIYAHGTSTCMILKG